MDIFDVSRYGYVDVLLNLLNSGINPNIQNIEGKTPLMFAVLWHQPLCVNILLRHRANPNIQCKSGTTALIFASSSKTRIDAAKLLLQFGANPDIKDKSGETALMYASSTDNIDCVKLLLLYGASITLKDNHGDTAITLGKGHSKRLLKNKYNLLLLLKHKNKDIISKLYKYI